MKVLVTGDPGGNLPALFKRVAAVNKSNGPFDLLFCVGSFFSHADCKEDAAPVSADAQAYTSGSKQAPMPTYFIGSFGAGSKEAMLSLSTASSNIQYLGPSGLKTLQGLNVAFLDGIYNAAAYKQDAQDVGSAAGCRHYTQADVNRLKVQLKSASGDVDLLLTCEWPEDILLATPAGSLPEGINKTGSSAVAELAGLARPRYHFAGTKNIFYARPPYMNTDLGAGAHVTRFIGLASVGNMAKQKSLHALGLVPAASMEIATLQQKPEGTTPSPYEAAAQAKKKRPNEDADGAQDWRWQVNKRPKGASLGTPGVVKDDYKTVFVRNISFKASEAEITDFFTQAGTVEDVRRGTDDQGRPKGYCHVQFTIDSAVERACRLSGALLLDREVYIDSAANGSRPIAPEPGKPVEGCWFCLSNPSADTDLVVSIGEECYCAMDKGAINEGHVLLLPIEHYASSLACSANAWAEMQRYLSAFKACAASQSKEVIAFERHLSLVKKGGNHCHINVVSIPASAAPKAKQAFQQAAQAQGFAFTALSKAVGKASRSQLQEVVGDSEYFLAILPDGSRLVHPISREERHPLDFGRQVVAQLAGTPDRADWKTCQLEKPQEIARTEAFKAVFQPYDVVNS
ncbi:hypothetical protein WJX82_011315 [Trebouxia sp. C0006]